VSTLVSQAEFARRQGWAKSYVTQLKQAGRLVMARKGRRELVDVQASLERIDATRDQNRDDVRRRHEQARHGGQPPTDRAEQIGKTFAAARSVRERYNALKAKVEYEQLIGRLLDADAVRRAALDAGATLRATLENIPDQLAPQLTTMGDREEIHGLLAEHIEHALAETSRALAAAARIEEQEQDRAA